MKIGKSSDYKKPIIGSCHHAKAIQPLQDGLLRNAFSNYVVYWLKLRRNTNPYDLAEQNFSFSFLRTGAMKCVVLFLACVAGTYFKEKTVRHKDKLQRHFLANLRTRLWPTENGQI